MTTTAPSTSSATRRTWGSTMWLDLMGIGLTQSFYDVGGVRTRVLEAGQGTPVLLLHGTGGHAETYQRTIGDLAEHYRVLVPDMLGHGYTGRPACPYTLDDYSAHLFGLLDTMGIDRLVLSGESLGGCVAAWMALERPERAEKLILNTGILDRPDEVGLQQLADLEERTKVLATNLTKEAVRRRLEWLVVDPATMTDEMVEIRYRIYSQPGMVDTVVEILHAVLEMNRGVYRGVDYMDHTRLAELRCPTQVIWTDHNPSKSYEVIKKAIDQIPDPDVVLIENAGHWPQFEQPDAVNRAMLDFLGRGDR
jgi:2-hydroxy-6-oxonona-2,4-dienedioate hydrolase